MANRTDYVDLSYEVIVKAFGTPDGTHDTYKSCAQWDLTTPYGWAEVYDYKSGETDPRKVDDWHVQATNEDAFEWVYEQLAAAQRAIETEERPAT